MGFVSHHNDHGQLTGLSDDDHLQYVKKDGRAGGQTVAGGTANGDDLTLQTTTAGVAGSYFLSHLSTNGVVTTSGGTGELGVNTTLVSSVAGKQPYHGIESIGALSFANASHILTIAAGVTYWIAGVQRINAGATTCDIDDYAALAARTLYWFYFDDATGTLKCSTTVNLRTQVPVATVYWNGAAGALQYEAHRYTRDIDWHLWAHDTIGTRYENNGGFAVTKPTAVLDEALQIEVGTLFDEDIEWTTTQQTTMRGWYKVNAGSYTFADYSLPYLGISGHCYYLDTGTYTLTDADHAKYVCYWVYGTLDVDRAIYVIPTHAAAPHNTIALARAETAPSLVGLGINPEIKLLYRFIYQGDAQFQEMQDYRTSSVLPGGGITSVAASSVTFSPQGTISATNVQAALEEVDTEKTTLAAVKADADVASAISLKHAAATVSAPLSVTGQALSLVNDATSTITEIDTGALANSDTVVPTSKAVLTKVGAYLPLGGGTMSGNITMGDGGTIGQAAGPLLAFDDTNNYLEITGANVAIGTTTSDAPLRLAGTQGSNGALLIERTHSTPSAQLLLARIAAISTGDMVDGFGPNVLFAIEDTEGTRRYIASLSAVRSGADNEGALVFNAGTNGAEEFVRIINTGSVTVNIGGLHVGGTSDPGADNLTVDGVTTTASLIATNLTDGYLPYHVSDVLGLANGPTKSDVDSAIALKHAVYAHPNHSGDVTSDGDGATTIASKAVHVSMLADGTDGELITWGADGVATTVPVGTATHVLTSNGAGASPTFQAVGSGDALVWALVFGG